MNNKGKGKKFANFLLKAAILCFLLYFGYTKYTKDINDVKEKCTPISTSEKKELDLNSTIVVDLYSKVATNIREDVASNNTLDDTLKLYLAYRQIPVNEIYESNCNKYSANMPSYECKDNQGYQITAFKKASIDLQLKKLFGTDHNIEYNNIQLGINCIGGYQYIPERDEFVRGTCTQLTTTTFKATKKLISATSEGPIITLKESTKYYGSENKKLPDTLQSGTYTYTFKLDPNYNYIYIDKTFEK